MGKKHSRDKAPRHVRIHHYMMATAAWKSLGCVERAMYVDIAARYAGFGSNNGRIGYSLREAAAELHISKTTAQRAIDTLQDRGFVVAMKKGAFSLKQRNSTEWRLTEFPCDVSNNMSTKEFMRWTPEKIKTRVLQRYRPGIVAVPIGYSSGTVQDSDTSDGYSSGTVKARLAS